MSKAKIRRALKGDSLRPEIQEAYIRLEGQIHLFISSENFKFHLFALHENFEFG